MSRKNATDDETDISPNADEWLDEVPEEKPENDEGSSDLDMIDTDDALDIPGEIMVIPWAGHRFHFGESVYFEYDEEGSDGEVETTHIPLGAHIWPIELYEHVDEDEHGVRLLYRVQSEDFRHATISADHFGSEYSACQGGQKLMKLGAQVNTGKASKIAKGLGYWRDEYGGEAPNVYVTNTPGFKRDGEVYVNGTEVFGEETWYADEERNIIMRRDSRSGTLDQWCGLVEENVDTPGLQAAIGTSLAGPLIGLLRDENFIVHYCGDSSSGKSTAARLAASVWGSPHTMFESWDTTVNALMNYCQFANGACLVLDELGVFQKGESEIAQAIYSIAAGTSRGRSTRTGDLQEQSTWSLTGFSTGEVSSLQKVGDHRKGGHSVRMIDIPIRPGEVTTSGEHAKRLNRTIEGSGRGGVYGHPGDKWIDYLMQTNPISLATRRRGYEGELRSFDDGSAETGRVLDSLALVGVALEKAGEADLVPWGSDTAHEVTSWLAERAIEGQEDTDPNRRMLRRFIETFDTSPQHYPDPRDADPNCQVYGWRVTNDDKPTIWTSKLLLKKSGLCRDAGVASPKRWLNWCEENDLCIRHRRRLPSRPDVQYRWGEFDPNEVRNFLE